MLSKIIRKPITVLTVSAVAIASSIVPTVALAGSYKGKCFNQLERDMDKCNIVIENGNVHLIMRASSNQGANQLITRSSIKKVERSKSSKRLSKTALWSTIALGPIGLFALAFKKKKMSYAIGYNKNGKVEGAVFVIRRSRTPLADIDFQNLGVKVTNLDAMEK